nr:MAG TPA: hypothetical protein [Caudoviricetes sp.]
MPKNLPDIIYDKNNITPIIDSTNSYYQIPMYKDIDYLSNYENYVSFVKGIEKMVRNDDRYKKYINYLKKKVKLDKCQVLKNVTDEDATIEMHHGPIFTLFDICAIVLEYFLIKKWKISTFRVANTVLMEHQQNRIGVVMVSTTIHEAIHNGEIFINYHQAWGDIAGFVDKYKCAMSDEYKEQLNKYIDRSLLYDSTDFSVLDLNKELKK